MKPCRLHVLCKEENAARFQHSIYVLSHHGPAVFPLVCFDRAYNRLEDDDIKIVVVFFWDICSIDLFILNGVLDMVFVVKGDCLFCRAAIV